MIWVVANDIIIVIPVLDTSIVEEFSYIWTWYSYSCYVPSPFSKLRLPLGLSGTHFGQHWPGGMIAFSPFSQACARQKTAEQSGVLSGTHFGQHWPGGTIAFSPSSQAWAIQKTAEQSGALSETHLGQHWPGGTTNISPFSQTGSRQETVEQSSTHSGQHCPSGMTRLSPIWQIGSGQETTEQSGVTLTAAIFTHAISI